MKVVAVLYLPRFVHPGFLAFSSFVSSTETSSLEPLDQFNPFHSSHRCNPGALASPRATRGCRGEEPLSSRAAPGAAEVYGCNRAISGGDDPENSRGPKTEGEPLGPRSRARGERGERLAVVAMPHELALLLREELDVSCHLGCDEAGAWESEGRGGAVDR